MREKKAAEVALDHDGRNKKKSSQLANRRKEEEQKGGGKTQREVENRGGCKDSSRKKNVRNKEREGGS